MPRRKKATNEELLEAYRRTGSIWAAGRELGMAGQTVHERLKAMGVDTSMNLFTDEDMTYLSERYALYRDAGRLQDLADEMGRTKQFICRKARALGLTDPNRKAYYARVWKEAPEAVLLPIWQDFKRSKKGVSAWCRSRGYNIQSFHDAMNRCFPDEYDYVVASKKPKSSQYARGRDFEYTVRDDMKKHGYIALRTPASKSPVDVYCIKRGELAFIQCKISGALPTGEWNTFFDFCESVGALPIMAQRPRQGRGIEYYRLTDKKDRSRRKSPMVPWQPTKKEERSNKEDER